jgi:hypothetical protein
MPSIWNHESAAQAASLQQAHFMPASLADSQASEGHEMRSRQYSERTLAVKGLSASGRECDADLQEPLSGVFRGDLDPTPALRCQSPRSSAARGTDSTNVVSRFVASRAVTTMVLTPPFTST